MQQQNALPTMPSVEEVRAVATPQTPLLTEVTKPSPLATLLFMGLVIFLASSGLALGAPLLTVSTMLLFTPLAVVPVANLVTRSVPTAFVAPAAEAGLR